MDRPKIIANAYVLTCDPRNRGGCFHLLIRGGRIVEVSENLDHLKSSNRYAAIIDATGKLIVPGFVNAHCHSESMLLRDYTKGLHFSLWKYDPRLREVSAKLLDPSSRADLKTLYLFSYFCHLKSGTTFVGEFGPPLDQVGFHEMLQSINQTGVRVVAALQNWDQIRYAQSTQAKSVRAGLNLGRDEDFTVYSFENLCRAAKELKMPLIAHIAEQQQDIDSVKRNFQKPVIEVLRQYKALKRDTVLLHLNHVSDQDVEMLAETSASVIVCPLSTALKQTGYPSLRLFPMHNIQICLGSDWGSVDMVDVMRFMSRLPLLLPGLPPLSPVEVVQMATIHGANALGVGAEFGSIEDGKFADLTFFDVSDLTFPPLDRSCNADTLADVLVNHLSARDVCDVMVNGEFRITGRHLADVSERDLATQFQELHTKFAKVTASVIERGGPRPIGQPPDHKPKMIPFVVADAPGNDEVEDFERGYKVAERPPRRTDTTHRDPSSQTRSTPPGQQQQEADKPDPPSDVKRVFGEDDF